MPGSKFRKRTPKYTPPKVCAKSPRGGAFDVPETTCPTALTLTALVTWPFALWPNTGEGTTALTISRLGQPGCTYYAQTKTLNGLTASMQLRFEPQPNQARIIIALSGGTFPPHEWVLDPATVAAPAATVLERTQIPSAIGYPDNGAVYATAAL